MVATRFRQQWIGILANASMASLPPSSPLPSLLCHPVPSHPIIPSFKRPQVRSLHLLSTRTTGIAGHYWSIYEPLFAIGKCT